MADGVRAARGGEVLHDRIWSPTLIKQEFDQLMSKYSRRPRKL